MKAPPPPRSLPKRPVPLMREERKPDINPAAFWFAAAMVCAFVAAFFLAVILRWAGRW